MVMDPASSEEGLVQLKSWTINLGEKQLEYQFRYLPGFS